ncbi:MAG TPA: tryptophan--tRNA ligase [Actinomycetota bacterium]|nr:tryptophan--tRNA ligase [Actinomycetota bacterium]
MAASLPFGGGITLNQSVSDAPKRVFSGIQPTGTPHLGNYLGALRNWVAQQEQYDAFYCIVDLHALTMPWDPAVLRRNSLEGAASLIACGIDPERSVLYLQSHVAQHSELAWILSCVARMGEVRRMIQFKEKSKGDVEGVGTGVLMYPVLQAADVLLYRAHGVPVGEDQRQHIELMRDIAIRFNNMFGETFVVPEAWIPPAGARIMALDDPTEKMSKSAGRPNSSILLMEPPERIAKKIKSAVTDSGRDIVAGAEKPAITNLLTIFSIVEDEPISHLEERFGGQGYAQFKAALADAVVERLRPIRERYEELMSDPAETEKLLQVGADKARVVAESTMADVWARIGLGDRP